MYLTWYRDRKKSMLGPGAQESDLTKCLYTYVAVIVAQQVTETIIFKCIQTYILC